MAVDCALRRCGTVAGLVADRKNAQQRLHDQLNTLCPGLSAPTGHGELGRSCRSSLRPARRCWRVRSVFAGRAPTPVADRTAGPAHQPHRRLLDHPLAGLFAAAGGCRATCRRLGRDLARYQALLADITAQEQEIKALLAGTQGQVLTSLPGVAENRAPRSRYIACRSQVPRRRAPLLRNRPRPGDVSVRNPAQAGAGSPVRAWPSTVTP